MFKDLKYYKELSEQLAYEITMYESSYQNFEKVIDFSVKPDKLNRDQKKVLEDFINFYQEVGIYNKGLTKSRYQKIRETIIERVNFLKEQKEIVDKTISLHEELEKLQNDKELDSVTMKKIKEKASDKYDPKTKKYNTYLNNLIEEYRNNRTKNIKKEMDDVKVRSNVIKSENNFIKVLSSIFGPFSDEVYNIWAKVHNFNTKNIRKYKSLNFLLKGSLVLLYASIIANLSLAGVLSPFLVVLGMGSTFAFAYIIIKHSLPFAKYPEEVALKKDVGSLRENWFRFQKSRGKGIVDTDIKLYEGVKFSKYNLDKEKVEDNLEEKDSEKEKTKPSSEPAIKEELKDKKEAKVETSKKVIEEEKKEPLKVENKKEVEPEKEKIVEENNQPEEVEETSKKVPKRRQSVDNSTMQEVNTGKKINSLRDVTVVLRKFQDKGINSVEDFYTLRNVKVFLGKNYSKTGDRNYLELMDMFGELVKKMPKELKDKVSTR